MARTDPNNISRYWWDRHVQGLSLMRADFTTHDFPLHTHEAVVVAVTELGGAFIKSRGRIEEAHPGRLFVSNPAEPQASWMGPSRHWRYRSLYLTRAAIDEVASHLGLEEVPYFTDNMFEDADLIRTFLRLHCSLQDASDNLEQRELLAAAFGLLFRRHGSGGGRIAPAPRDFVLARRVVDLMQAHFTETLHLEDLASLVDLTPYQLIGLFRRTLGLTPHAYLVQVRLYAACRHLRTRMPLAQVAAAAGFYDQSQLSRHFKRCYGMTPLQFANAAGSCNFQQYGGGVAA